MTPKLVTFDCASTLLEVNWTPKRSVTMCAERLGFELPSGAPEAFQSLFLEWRPEYRSANLTRDPAALHDFWVDLHREWLRPIDLDPDLPARFVHVGEGLTHGPEQLWFRPFSDTEPCLCRLRDSGIRMAVVSNWDISLHAILSSLGIADHFELIVASLEEGVEKPDPEIFRIALARLGAAPEETIHIGDHVVDDIQGAEAAGIRAFLLDRTAGSPAGNVICSLDQLPEAFAWSV